MNQLIFTKYANRFSSKRKQQFRTAAIQEIRSYGHEVTIDKSLFATNIYFGDIEARYMLTAHYDTATNMALVYPFIKYFGARVGQFAILLPILIYANLFPESYFLLLPFLLLVLGIPLLIPNKYNYNDNTSGVLTILEHAKQNQDNPHFFYALTDNEEKGLFGAKALRKFLKKNQRIGKILNINVDCVGCGDYFAITSSMNSKYFDYAHNRCLEYRDIKKIKSKLLSSDHILFGNKGIMLTKVNDAKLTPDVYIPNLHTNRDQDFNHANIAETLNFINKITGEIN